MHGFCCQVTSVSGISSLRLGMPTPEIHGLPMHCSGEVSASIPDDGGWMLHERALP